MPSHKRRPQEQKHTQMLARPQDDGLDTGPRKTAPGSERFCAATGAVVPVAEMIRFVVAPDGSIVPDLKRRLPGRGIWVTATRQALRTAVAYNDYCRATSARLADAMAA